MKDARTVAHEIARSRCRWSPGQEETHGALCDSIAVAIRNARAEVWEEAGRAVRLYTKKDRGRTQAVEFEARAKAERDGK